MHRSWGAFTSHGLWPMPESLHLSLLYPGSTGNKKCGLGHSLLGKIKQAVCRKVKKNHPNSQIPEEDNLTRPTGRCLCYLEQVCWKHYHLLPLLMLRWKHGWDCWIWQRSTRSERKKSEFSLTSNTMRVIQLWTKVTEGGNKETQSMCVNQR